MEFDLENPLTSFKEHQSDTIPTLFASESNHTPSHNFKSRDFHASFRRQAISLIFQAQYSCDFDQIQSYLAVNYMDRFLSTQEIPQGKPWILRLLVISCLSLASKMKNTNLSFSDFQRDEGFIFDAQTIQRMELIILSALKWRMRSITPFSFVYFFLSLFDLKDPPLMLALKDRAADFIFKSHHEMEILEFKPSIIAASALLSASNELFPLQFRSFRNAISCCEYVNNENVLKCYSLMQERVVVLMDEYESFLERESSSTKTPISVLELNRHSKISKSETITITATGGGSSSSSSRLQSQATGSGSVTERYIKRRKLNDFCTTTTTTTKCTFQISQIQHC